ncbi:MAG: EAL domain-containing protein [Treponema sp.]|nr:EAL domain-containing protein [Treponema sp.]
MSVLENIKANAKRLGLPEIEDTQEFLIQYIQYSDHHDARFTNVFNLHYTHHVLQTFIDEKKINEYGIAFFNIQNFSQINHDYGQTKGSKLLEDYIHKIEEKLKLDGHNGLAAMSDGNSGVIVFPKNDISKVIQILSGEEFQIENKDGKTDNITLSSQAGINTSLENYTESYQIIDSVLMTLNIARKTAGVKIVYYDETLKNKIDQERQIEGWFMDALKNEEFKVYYQPKVDLHNYKLKGAEALVRWFHEDQMVFPDNFIPILEKNFSIKYLDMYMLNHVCASVERWISEGKEPVQISVNLSRASLVMRNIVSVITSTIDKYKIPRSLIQIELTESASGTSNEELKPVVMELNREGISTAMDDFGTGYSSLSLIKELPWNMLKIDKSLLHGAQKEGSVDQKMFKSIISMANDIGLECIVEGVETRDDIRLLKESNCWLAQGYYFSKPITEPEFEKLL